MAGNWRQVGSGIKKQVAMETSHGVDCNHLECIQLIKRMEGGWRHAGWPRVLRRDSEGSLGIRYMALERKPKAVKNQQKGE